MKKSCTIFVLLFLFISSALTAADAEKTAADEHRRQSDLELKEILNEMAEKKAERALEAKAHNDKIKADAQYLANKEKTERAAAATRAILTKEESDPSNWTESHYLSEQNSDMPVKHACMRNKKNKHLLSRHNSRQISRNNGLTWIKVKKAPTQAFVKGNN